MLDQISEITGIDLSLFTELFVEKTITSRMADVNCYSSDHYIKLLKTGGTETEALKKALNNHYSEFFRNTLTFAYIEHYIIPCLASGLSNRNRREIRIWSAACAAGQEAYSIAMLCDEYSKNHASGIRFRIFATDISEAEIQKAQLGVYQENALRNVSHERIGTYFTKNGDGFLVHPKLKEYIDFSTFDLLSERNLCPPASIFGNFDLVFCANLLFYYSQKAQKIMLDKVDTCLDNQGYLVVGDAEKEIVENLIGYREINHIHLLQKLL